MAALPFDADRMRQALSVLVAAGLVASDGFAGLRMLVAAVAGPRAARRSARQPRRPLERAAAGSAARDVARRGDRAAGMDAAAALRRRVPAAAHPRDHCGAVARPGARVPPSRSARRNSRRPLRVGHGRRAVRAAGRRAGAARGAAHAGQRRDLLDLHRRSAQPRRHRHRGRAPARRQAATGWPTATACRWRRSRTRCSGCWCRSRRRRRPPRPARWPAGPRLRLHRPAAAIN